MANDLGGLAVTPLVLTDIIHTLSPPPNPQQRSTDVNSSEPQGSSGSLLAPPVEFANQNSVPGGAHPSLPLPQLSLQPSNKSGEDVEMAEDSSLEPATDADVANMKRRLVEMGLTHEDGINLANGHNRSPREGELLDMVLTLIRSRISSSQLHYQANIIADMQAHQEYLVSQFKEEKLRWQNEREGWDRTAEALIRQRNKPGSGASPDEELERKCSTLEADNRILRDRLQETHNRAAVLEAEIMKLKPMLFMLPLSPSLEPGTSVPSVQLLAEKGNKNKQGTPQTEDRQPDREATPTNVRFANGQSVSPSEPSTRLRPAFSSAELLPPAVSNAGATSQNPNTGSTPLYRSHLYPYAFSLLPAPGTIQVQSAYAQGASTGPTSKGVNPYLTYTIQNSRLQALTTGPNTASATTSTSPTASSPTAKTSKGLPPSASAPSTTVKVKRRAAHSSAMTSDARTEHLLLAARKIGKERAAFVAGFMQHAEKEKDRYAREQENSRLLKEAEKMERDRLDRVRNGGSGTTYYRSNGSGGLSSKQIEGSSSQRKESASTTNKETSSPQKRSRQPTFVYVRTPGAPAIPEGYGLPEGPARPLGKDHSAGSQFQHYHGHPNSATHAQGHDKRDDDTGSYRTVCMPLQQASALPGPNGAPATPQQQQGQPQASQTPLDSLVNAALGMQGSEGSNDIGSVGGSKHAAPGRRRKVAETENPESPTPKRRRTTNGSSSRGTSYAAHANQKSASKATKESRVPSALDVLADQAQVAVPMSQKRSPTQRKEGKQLANVPVNGMGKAKANRGSPSRKSIRGKGKLKDVAEDDRAENGDGDVQIPEEHTPSDEDEPEVEEKASPPVAKESIATQPKRRGRPRKDAQKKEAQVDSVKVRVISSGRVTRNSGGTSVAEVESTSSKKRRPPPRDRTVASAAPSSASGASQPATSFSARAKGKGKEKERGEAESDAKSTTKGKRRAKAGGEVEIAGGGSGEEENDATGASGLVGDKAAVGDCGGLTSPRIIAPPPTEGGTRFPSLGVSEDVGVTAMRDTEIPTSPTSQPPDDETLDSLPTQRAHAGSQTPTGDIDKEALTLKQVNTPVADQMVLASPVASTNTSLEGVPQESQAQDGDDGAVALVDPVEESMVVGQIARNLSREVSMDEIRVTDHIVSTDVIVDEAADQPSGAESPVLVKENVETGRVPAKFKPRLIVDEPLSPSGGFPGDVDMDGPYPVRKRSSAQGGPPEVSSQEASIFSASPGGPRAIPFIPDDRLTAIINHATDDATTLPDSGEIIETTISPTTVPQLPHDASGISTASPSPSMSTPKIDRHQTIPVPLADVDHDPPVNAHSNAPHDSDMDAEAEEDDEDMDAEGEEDEDIDGAEGVWPQISFSSTEISKSMASMDPLGEDADAEGEIEDDLEEPPEAVYQPSELVLGAN